MCLYQRGGFHIPCVRNPVEESTVRGRPGLDLDGSIRAAKRDLEKAKAQGRSHLVSAIRCDRSVGLPALRTAQFRVAFHVI